MISHQNLSLRNPKMWNPPFECDQRLTHFWCILGKRICSEQSESWKTSLYRPLLHCCLKYRCMPPPYTHKHLAQQPRSPYVRLFNEFPRIRRSHKLLETPTDRMSFGAHTDTHWAPQSRVLLSSLIYILRQTHARRTSTERAWRRIARRERAERHTRWLHAYYEQQYKPVGLPLASDENTIQFS